MNENSKGEYTPGPWHYSHEQGNGKGEYQNTLRRWRIDSESRGLMLTAEALNTFSDDPGVWDEVEANVRLASAAPDMYEALNVIMGNLESMGIQIANEDMAFKAIAKAEGMD